MVITSRDKKMHMQTKQKQTERADKYRLNDKIELPRHQCHFQFDNVCDKKGTKGIELRKILQFCMRCALNGMLAKTLPIYL